MFNAPTFLDETHDPEALALDLNSLRRFARPALLTVGEEGPRFFRPVVERLANALRRVEQQTFLGAGHEPEYTHPDAYVATLSEFIMRVASQTATMTQGNAR